MVDFPEPLGAENMITLADTVSRCVWGLHYIEHLLFDLF